LALFFKVEMGKNSLWPKTRFFILYYYIYFFHFLSKLKKKVGFWPNGIFLTYLR